MTDGELMAKLIDLDVTRGRLAELKADAERLSEEVVSELSRRKVERFEFAGKAAVLTRSESLRVDVDEFRHACLDAGLDTVQTQSAIETKVLLAKARKLLGEDALRAIGRMTRGAWSVRIVSNGRGN